MIRKERYGIMKKYKTEEVELRAGTKKPEFFSNSLSSILKLYIIDLSVVNISGLQTT